MGPKKDKGKDAKGGKGDKKGAAGPAKNAKGGKTKKKSWTKIKVKDKLANAVFIDQKAYEKIVKEAPRILTLTVASVIDKFKVNGAVARKILRDLHSKGLIKQCGDHNAHFTLFTGAQVGKPVEGAKPEGQPAKKGDAKEQPAKKAPAKGGDKKAPATDAKAE